MHSPVGRGGAVTLAAILAIVLGGCDRPDSTPAPAPPNQAPTITSAATASVVENGSLNYQVTGTDPDGDALTYTINGGADAAQFTIDANGRINFATAPNFEAPADANHDNVYEVEVAASDGKAKGTKVVVVTVGDSREGIVVRRVATGLTNTVSIGFQQGTFIAFQRDGTMKTSGIGAGPAGNGVSIGLNDMAPNGLIAASVESNGLHQQHNMRIVYIDNSQRLILRSFYQGAAFGGSCPFVLLPHVENPSEITAWVSTNLLAIGATQSGVSPSLAQDPTSNIGKLFDLKVTPNPCSFDLTLRAMGLHDVRGVAYVIADHGTGVAEELNLEMGVGVQNFGWPFREGSEALGGTPPSGLIDPVSSYSSRGPDSIGSDIAAGFVYTTNDPIASLRGKYVFADRESGAIFTIPAAKLTGQQIPISSYENRTLDFRPDIGGLEHPTLLMRMDGIMGSPSYIYILDRDGDLFTVTAE